MRSPWFGGVPGCRQVSSDRMTAGLKPASNGETKAQRGITNEAPAKRRSAKFKQAAQRQIELSQNPTLQGASVARVIRTVSYWYSRLGRKRKFDIFPSGSTNTRIIRALSPLARRNTEMSGVVVPCPALFDQTVVALLSDPPAEAVLDGIGLAIVQRIDGPHTIEAGSSPASAAPSPTCRSAPPARRRDGGCFVRSWWCWGTACTGSWRGGRGGRSAG